LLHVTDFALVVSSSASEVFTMLTEKAPMQSRARYWAFFSLGLLLLVFVAYWWTTSIQIDRLRGGQRVWQVWQFLGLDFLNNYHATRHWQNGGDPFREPFGDPLSRDFCYPPLVLPVFAWCRWLTLHQAVVSWTVFLTVVTALGTFGCLGCRRALGLSKIPWTAALSGVLCSVPFLFAMERGNYDLLLLIPLGLAAWALREKSWPRDGLAGGALALAALLKIYPAFLALAFLPLRRFRAAACFVVVAVCLSLFHYHDWSAMRENMARLIPRVSPNYTHDLGWASHTLSGSWQLIWQGTRFRALAKIPNAVGALAVIMPGVSWISWRLWRCPAPKALIGPYLLWLASAAVFIPEVSNDYNLVFLPLAAVAVWDRRDPIPVHMGMGLCAVWCQPVPLGISSFTLLGMKLLSLAAVGGSLLCRIHEQTATGELCLDNEKPIAEADRVRAVTAAA
jgi:hypothetical protein